MEIKMPCAFGEVVNTDNGPEILNGVSWSQWSHGLLFTYYYKRKSKWSECYMETEVHPKYKTYYEIENTLIEDDYLKSKGYPLKGTGSLYGLNLIDGKLYGDVILSDYYFAHVKIECDVQGLYITGGEVLTPPSWDTKEKMYSIIPKKYGNIKVSCIPW